MRRLGFQIQRQRTCSIRTFFSSLSFNTHGRNMTDPHTEFDRQLQELADQARFWGAFGLYAFVSMAHFSAQVLLLWTYICIFFIERGMGCSLEHYRPNFWLVVCRRNPSRQIVRELYILMLAL
ncbi:hypothetical protein L6452_12801 [Arctium lappa]|uniref:Uncharacterized protein n=1 Tax=Arctium lappa TaxID=4217 RepID=A0ACB9CGE7_ARCLA|nr:hypothetical protein L6452_12801 [Arctium lappa]